MSRYNTLSTVLRQSSPNCYTHYCPGCKHIHVFNTVPLRPDGPKWSFDGNVTNPAFLPSMHISWGDTRDQTTGEVWQTAGVCHYWLRGNGIEFLADCTHELAGQTVPLPEHYTPERGYVVVPLVQP